VPPIDLKADYLAHKDGIDRAIHRVLESGHYILGQEVAAFEEEFAGYVGARFAVGVGNGTDALHLALRACGIGPGDAVITVSHTATATVAAIELAEATPVLVDIHPDTLTMDPARLEETVLGMLGGHSSAGAPRPRAVIPVHLYGLPADMPAILDIAGRYDLLVIEDSAQSHGAAIRGVKTGAWGHVAAFSFYPTKNLGALGDGGALVTSDHALAERAGQLRQYGWRLRYVSDFPGMNSRLDELQAAILREKLPFLDRQNARRREIARIYDSLLPAGAFRRTSVPSGITHAYHQYVVRCARRDDARAFLKASGVGTLIHYPVPVHKQPAYQDRVPIGSGGLQHTEQACREVLSLPMHPLLTDEDASRVGECLRSWSRRRGISG
jgi:dTDP-4-amino-4,6-dideoxygalactose transaminase